MEYGRLELIEGKNGYEKTALTMMKISELLAEEGTTMEELTKMQQAEVASAPPAPSALQQPPHMRSATPAADPNTATIPRALPIVSEPMSAKPVKKPRSFLTSLLGQ